MHNFIKLLINEKKKVILVCLTILLIFSIVYLLKFIGIAAEEDSEIIELSEVEVNNLDFAEEAVLEENETIINDEEQENIDDITVDNEKNNTNQESDTTEESLTIDMEDIIQSEENNITDDAKDDVDFLEPNEEIDFLEQNEEIEQIPTEIISANEVYKVTVSAVTDGALKDIKDVVVTPITTEDNDNKYNEILYKLNQKVTLESKELAGFLAYDIKLIDDFGNEKEPDGNVNISIEYNKLPDLVVQNSNIDVSVIHFDNSDDVEKLVEYSQEKDNLTIEKNNENQIKKLEFETDSFSCFTITWTIDTIRTANIKIYYVDSNGNEIQGSITEDITVTLDDIINLTNYIGTIDNYVYTNAHYDSYDGILITNIGFKNNEIQNTNVDVNLYYMTELVKTFALNDENQVVNIDLYLVYNKIGNLTIQNDIKDNGVLKAVLTDSDGNELPVQNDTSRLVWYKCDTANGTYSEVSRVSISDLSDVFNISIDGTEINVALDQGARQYYKVKLINVEGKVLAESSSVQVEYYDDVQNGGFENLNILTYYQGSSWGSSSTGIIRQIKNDTEGLMWKTTGTDGKIELARNGTTNNYHLEYYYLNSDGAAEGKQFAELNCDSTGALYQDILAAPGEVLNWSLDHRGRYGEDTMYVVAIATTYFESITSYSELQTVIQNIIDNPSDYPDAYCVSITDDNTKWKQHSGSFVIPEGQYLTRFFFVAGKTANGDDKTGNFIDDVVLSQDVVTSPENEESIITIKKVINVPYSIKEIQNTTLNISLYDSENNILNANNQKFTTFAYDKTNKVWFAIKTFTINNPEAISAINIIESDFEDSFENYSFYSANYILTDTTLGQNLQGSGLTIDDKNGDLVGVLNNIDTATVLLSKGHNYTLTIENNYIEDGTELIINKINLFGLKLKGSSFKIYKATLQGDEEAISAVSETYDVDDGADDGKITFKNLKYDTEYIIEEVSPPNDNYYLLEKPIHVKLSFENGTKTLNILNLDDFKEGYVTKTENTTNELNVVNIQHTAMPKAGGSGNYWIYLLGIFIMTNTAIIYKRLKK